MNVQVAPQTLPEAVSVPVSVPDTQASAAMVPGTVLTILLGVSAAHLLNDLMQSLLPSIYPLLKTNYGLSFLQLGMLTLVFQITASLLQPLVGMYTDKHPKPYSLTIGMGFTLIGLLLLSRAHAYWLLLVAAALVGTGSSVFHPESSRVARLASGGRFGFAQSLFQVGGNAGQAIGPLAGVFVVSHGQWSVALFGTVAVLAMLLLTAIGRWYAAALAARSRAKRTAGHAHNLSRRRVQISVVLLLLLIFSKYVYTASMTNYYIFYLVQRFHIPVPQAQGYLAVYLAAFAAGTFLGGPVGDWIGRKYVIWVSILGVLPFTLALPYVGLATTVVLTVIIGLVLSSAFAAILVFAQELLPGRVGMVAGLFFGFAFGIAGVSAAVLGNVADHVGIEAVYRICAFLPLIGLCAAFLPDMSERRRAV